MPEIDIRDWPERVRERYENYLVPVTKLVCP